MAHLKPDIELLFAGLLLFRDKSKKVERRLEVAFHPHQHHEPLISVETRRRDDDVLLGEPFELDPRRATRVRLIVAQKPNEPMFTPELQKEMPQFKVFHPNRRPNENENFFKPTFHIPAGIFDRLVSYAVHIQNLRGDKSLEYLAAFVRAEIAIEDGGEAVLEFVGAPSISIPLPKDPQKRHLIKVSNLPTSGTHGATSHFKLFYDGFHQVVPLIEQFDVFGVVPEEFDDNGNKFRPSRPCLSLMVEPE